MRYITTWSYNHNTSSLGAAENYLETARAENRSTKKEILVKESQHEIRKEKDGSYTATISFDVWEV